MCLPFIPGRCQFAVFQAVSWTSRCLWSLQCLGAGRWGWKSKMLGWPESGGDTLRSTNHLFSQQHVCAQAFGFERVTSGSGSGRWPFGVASGQQRKDVGWAWPNAPCHEPMEPRPVIAGGLWRCFLGLPSPFYLTGKHALYEAPRLAFYFFLHSYLSRSEQDWEGRAGLQRDLSWLEIGSP